MSFARGSDYRIVQQKIYYTDIQYAAIVVPALAYVMPHDDLREGIPGQRKGLVLRDGFSSVPSA